MRCPDCGLMVSYNTEETPEGGEATVDGQTVSVMGVRRVLTCAECGTELKDTELDVEGMPITVVPWEGTEGEDTRMAGREGEDPGDPCEDAEHEWETEGEPDLEPTEERVRGKVHYGVDVSGGVKCSKCGITGTYKGSEREAVGEFNDLT